MTLTDVTKNHPAVFFFTAIVAGFLAGIGTYKGILEIAQLEVVGKQESAALRRELDDRKQEAAVLKQEVAALKAGAPATMEKPNSGSDASVSTARLALTRFPEVEGFATLLRQYGYHVDLVPPEPGTAKKEDFSVITVGFNVPPNIGAKAIHLTHEQMPWVKYVCFQNPPGDKTLFLNASNQWIGARGLRQLRDADFDLLTEEGQSIEEFRQRIAAFGR